MIEKNAEEWPDEDAWIIFQTFTDKQILAGIQAVFNLATLRAVWTDADYLDEFKKAADSTLEK